MKDPLQCTTKKKQDHFKQEQYQPIVVFQVANDIIKLILLVFKIVICSFSKQMNSNTPFSFLLPVPCEITQLLFFRHLL